MILRPLNDSSQFEEIDQLSEHQDVVIFKHSTRCVISAMAWDRLQREWDEQVPEVPVYFLDLIRYRATSNAVVSHYGIDHESPQLIFIRNGMVHYQTSHNGINVKDIKELIDA
jgi:bacillithiol system protein YtxJ